MKLYMPTMVLCAKDCIKEHGTELTRFGTKAMIVTGKYSSRINGSLEHIMAALKERKIDYVVFDDIEENPCVETIMKAREIGVSAGVEFVIGVGGGSPMDAAKAIALMIANREKSETILYENRVLPHLPVVAVPTTAGTGSEVTPYAILTIHQQRTKQSISHRIFPELALVDFSYLKTISRECLLNTAVDALSHLLESYLNKNTNELNRIYSERGLKIWGSIKAELEANTLNDKSYEKLMEASMLGGVAIAHTGTSLPHALSYVVTYELGMPHGKAVGIFLSGYLACYQNKQDVKKVMELLGFEDVNGFAHYIQTILVGPSIPTAINKKTVDAAWSNKAKLANYPYEITYDELLDFSDIFSAKCEEI